MSRTRQLLSLPKTLKVSLRTDDHEYIGPECPQQACKRVRAWAETLIAHLASPS